MAFRTIEYKEQMMAEISELLSPEIANHFMRVMHRSVLPLPGAFNDDLLYEMAPNMNQDHARERPRAARPNEEEPVVIHQSPTPHRVRTPSAPRKLRCAVSRTPTTDELGDKYQTPRRKRVQVVPKAPRKMTRSTPRAIRRPHTRRSLFG